MHYIIFTFYYMSNKHTVDVLLKGDKSFFSENEIFIPPDKAVPKVYLWVISGIK